MTSKRKRTIGTLVGLETILAGSAFARSNIASLLGTVPAYDFGIAAPVIQDRLWSKSTLLRWGPAILSCGISTKATSYVFILMHGKLTEEHLVAPNQCTSEEFIAGSAFSSLRVRYTT